MENRVSGSIIKRLGFVYRIENEVSLLSLGIICLRAMDMQKNEAIDTAEIGSLANKNKKERNEEKK